MDLSKTAARERQLAHLTETIRRLEQQAGAQRHSENEHKYRTRFEAAGAAVMLSEGGTFIDCTQQAQAMFRCRRVQIKPFMADGNSFWPLTQPDSTNSHPCARYGGRIPMRRRCWTAIGTRCAAA